MKILFLNPPFLPWFSRESRSPCVTKGGTFYYPYYLAYAAGASEQAGFDVKLVDAIANEWTHEETYKFVKKLEPDLVVLDTSTPSIYNDIQVGEKIKEMLENVHVTLVGTHPSRLPEWTFQNSEKIDSIAIGEFDYTIRDLAEALEKGKSLKTVKGLMYRKGKRIIRTEPRPLIKNLDDLPWVSDVYRRHFGKEGIKKYFYASLRWPEITILTARGCPFNCAFCPIPFKNSYRARSVKDAVDEFEFIQNEMPYVKEVMIEDDTFPVSKHRTIEFAKEMKRRGIKIKWSCNARVDTDYETLKWMKSAGCRLLCVGFESPDQSALDAINKRTTKELQERFVKYTKVLGLLVNGCYILGLPGETTETIKKTIEFAKHLNTDTAQFYPLMVYPGTAAYEWAKQNGYLMTEDYSKWIHEDGTMATTVDRPGLPADLVEEYTYLAKKAYYLRLRYILPKLWQMVKNPDEAIRTLKSFKVFWKYILKR